MTDPRIALLARGYTDLVSVAPPDAPVSANSSLKVDDLGKRPAKKGNAGWYGYNWLYGEASQADVEAWVRWGSNVGLRGTNFPALDIDVLDADLVQDIRKLALGELGKAPVRVGKAPKELLVYRLLGVPFKRMAVKLPGGGLVEMLGDQRQYLVYGKHPSGVDYRWLRKPLWKIDPTALAAVTSDSVVAFLTKLAERYDGEVVGQHTSRVVEDQETLHAPSMQALAECVAAIPNDYEERDEYITVGCAIKAAGYVDEEQAFDIFLQWCSRWEDGANDPDNTRADWRRMHPPYRVGWDYLASRAGERTGFNESVHVFEADADYEPVRVEKDQADIPVDFTDDWLAEQILPRLNDRLRYDYPNDQWHHWDGTRWANAATGEQERVVVRALRALKVELTVRAGKLEGKPKQKAFATLAKLGNVSTMTNVIRMLQSHPDVAVGTDAFDTVDMELNTPGGTVDLVTGELLPHDASHMHSRSTSVTPKPGRAPRWEQFLSEVTKGDKALEHFLQKTVGYALTGIRREQTLNFVWGAGGNGKSVWIDTLMGVMDEYAATAPMDTFAATKGDKHPTDLAGLMGARLVTSSETQAGRSWDETRIKAVTGGDRLRARFMRQDFVEFTPRFKLIFVGNHEPQIDNVDDAMRRRIHIIPFTFKPETPDLRLPEKLKEEWPQILAWAIEGCLAWQNEGLEAPEAVLSRTQQYFDEENQPARWLEEQCVLEEGAQMSTADGYISWSQWMNAQGERAGTQRDFTKALRPLESEHDLKYMKFGPRDKRVRGWKGVRLVEDPHEIRGTLS